jgi:competence protein ComEC
MLLHDVLRCYEVGEVYDVGVLNDKRFYRGFLEAVAEEPDVTYWTVVDPPSPKTIDIYGAEINFTDVTWNTFAEGHVIELGAGAKLIVLAANGDHHPNDFNENSLVVRLELGDHSALLMGDAEAGDRVSPDEDPPPTAKKDDAHQHEEHTEGYLMRYHAAEIDVDILQVGHHGSMTSSRPDFIAAVSPTWSLIGAGPRRYTGHRLPDATVQRMLEDLAKEAGGFVLNTDFDDRRCPVANRVGRDHRPDEGNGGCSNYVLFLGP